MIDGIGTGGPDLAGMVEGARSADEARRLEGLKGAERAAAARQMESLFVSTLVKEMRKTLPEGGFFGKGPGSHVLQGMFERMLGESLAEGRGIGLRDFILESLPPEGVSPEAAGKSEVDGSAPSTASEKATVSADGPATLERNEGRTSR